jgi:hypothetical protein
MRLDGAGVPNAMGRAVFHAEAGLRAVFEPALDEHWSLRVLLEGSAPLSRPVMTFGAQKVWQQPWVSAHLGILLGYRF